MKLWLDDTRHPATHGRLGWDWAKTADEAIAMLATGLVEQADLDHDLTPHQSAGLPCQHKSGYDVVLWMAKHNVWPPKGTTCHSANPIGKQRMEKLIAESGGLK